jgi:hypothetical protein
MEIEPSHNEALKNVCKVKEMLKHYIEIRIGFEIILDCLELLDKTEEILAKG